ncbi:hypothetical protein B0H11DRAFT_2273883 [Mycena galericulata]|nr:hypothetical protein B0H11DRAFT_2273883 [Mycena galericulata]
MSNLVWKPPAQLAGTLLPKFHFELNFIEQVWGYAKRIYRFYPASSREDDLDRNVRETLAAVPLPMTQRLNGRQTAWAARKYRGHHIVPEFILDELDSAGIV